MTDDMLARVTRLRRRLHQIPELGFEERETSDLICETLDGLGISYHRGLAETGVVATVQKGSSPKSIGLRADIDALPINEQTNLEYRSTKPGVMHACGHDGHTAMLLGAAEMLSTQSDFDGTVYLIFQPAEEHGQGALRMIDDGLFERFPADSVFGMHNIPWMKVGEMAMRPGPIMGAEDNFEIDVKARGGHAAMPHNTKDAMTIAASIVTELQTIVSRSVDPLESAVVSCTEFITDGAVNVIPTTVKIKGDTRSFLPEISELIERRMSRIVRGLCEAHDVEYAFSYKRVFLPTINSEAEAALCARVAGKVVGEAAVNPDCAPLMGAEDFGAMLLKRPGCYVFLGNQGADGTGAAMLHNAGYDFNDEAIPTGVAYWQKLVETALPVG